MKSLVYSGPHPEVHVMDGGEAVLDEVLRDVPVGVEDGLADRLLEQDCWKLAGEPPAPVNPVAPRPDAATTTAGS
jgi:hypothetical protein